MLPAQDAALSTAQAAVNPAGAEVCAGDPRRRNEHRLPHLKIAAGAGGQLEFDAAIVQVMVCCEPLAPNMAFRSSTPLTLPDTVLVAANSPKSWRCCLTAVRSALRPSRPIHPGLPGRSLRTWPRFHPRLSVPRRTP